MIAAARDTAFQLFVEVILIMGMFFSSVAVLFCGSVAANVLLMPHFTLRESIQFEMQAIRDEESAKGIHLDTPALSDPLEILDLLVADDLRR